VIIVVVVSEGCVPDILAGVLICVDDVVIKVVAEDEVVPVS